MAVRSALEGLKFELCDASSGVSGIEAAKSFAPDCILLDYRLPDMDGIEIIEALRLPDQTLPCAIVMLTATANGLVASAALKLGAMDYLNKTRVNEDSMRIAVVSAVERFRAAREQRAAAEQNALLAAIVAASGDAIVAVNLDGEFSTWNSAAESLLGYRADEVIGNRPENLIIPPSRHAEYEAVFEAVASGRQATVSETLRQHKDGTLLDVEINASPIFDGQGKVFGISAIFRDVRERKAAERRQQMLMKELTHRAKNLFSVVQSIARLSLTNVNSIEDAKNRLSGRLEALSRTYGMLTDAGFEGSRLKEILSAELVPFGDRAQASGPDIILNAKAAQTFALVAHELATNAAKYGALSVLAGQLTVGWRIAGAPGAQRLHFEWIESGGPPTAPPKRKGFGSTLISAVAASDFDCRPVLSYEPEGFRYRFEAALAEMGRAATPSPLRQKLKSNILIALYDQWKGQADRSDELPEFKFFDRGPFNGHGGLTVASISSDDTLHFIQIGQALQERLGRPIQDNGNGEDESSLLAAYRRCAKTSRPSYEHLRFDFGDGDTVDFERLLLPYTEDGTRVSHLVGIAVFSGDTGGAQ
jgi:PAS domain S-box-containing protein